MSYVSGVIPYVAMGGNTRGYSASSSNIAVTCSNATEPHDLIVLIVSSTVDPFLMTANGHGWCLLDGFYDGANAYGVSLWASLAVRSGNSLTGTGITIPTGGYMYSSYCYRAIPPFRFALAEAVGAFNSYNDTADSRAMYWNAFAVAGKAINPAQGITLRGCACTNNGTNSTSATALTNYTERQDQAVTAAPSMNVYLMDRTTLDQSVNDAYEQIGSATFWAATSTHTKRASVSAFVPVIGNVAAYRGRYLSGRRVGG